MSGDKNLAADLTSCLHLLNDEFLGLQQEVAVVRPLVGEVSTERAECPEGLWVFSLQLFGHVEAVHHLTLTSFLSLVDAVQNLHLAAPATHMQHKCSFYNNDDIKPKCQQAETNL